MEDDVKDLDKFPYKCLSLSSKPKPPAVTDLAPGDSCDTDSECYRKSTCDSGICTIPSTNDPTKILCNDIDYDIKTNPTRNCPEKYYCKLTTNDQANAYCSKILNIGDTCTGETFMKTNKDFICGFGKYCNSKENQCQNIFQIENGKETDGNDSKSCASQFVLEIKNKFFCMPAPQANSSLIHEISLGSQCNFNSFEDTENFQNFVNKQNPAVCGFNSNDFAWCPSHKGDPTFENWAQEVNELYSGDFNCSPDSTEDRCRDFIVSHGESYNLMKLRANYSIQNPMGNANVRDNDSCVRSMITADFWGNSFNFSIIGTFLISLLSMT